ncbi:MAG: GNAT family N-acetyltransferase [Rhodobacterales bacterium]
MTTHSSIARDISYAHSASSKGGRALIRMMENATGRISLIRRAAGYEQDLARGRDFLQVMVERYGLSLDIVRGALDLIPREGLLILIANHPYGILDGLMLGHILSRARGDVRILARHVFCKAPDLARAILPIYFDGHTSRMFQIASHLHYTLRMGLLIKEFAKRVDKPVRVAVGQPIPARQIAAQAGDGKAMMDFLRKATYDLSATPHRSCEYGVEFEQKHRA